MFEKYKKLAINAVLAAIYVGVSTWVATGGEFSKAAFGAALAAAGRALLGAIAEYFGKPVPVDK